MAIQCPDCQGTGEYRAICGRGDKHGPHPAKRMGIRVDCPGLEASGVKCPYCKGSGEMPR